MLRPVFLTHLSEVAEQPEFLTTLYVDGKILSVASLYRP